MNTVSNANPYLRNRPIFICGHPKAGTSLIRAVFDSHPQLVVYPEETIFFRRFLPRAVGINLSQQLELADECLIHIFKWDKSNPTPSQAGFPDRDYSAIDFKAVRETMRRFAGSHLQHTGDILSAAVLAYGIVQGQIDANTRHWVEKSPYNEYFAKQIYEWWPDARCIHVLRDPRDNYASYRRKHPDWQAEFFAANWKRSTQAGVNNQAQFGADRYLMIRYEDLTLSPEAVLREMTRFLEIAWDESLTSPTRAGEEWAGNSMFADEFRRISSAPVARWKQELSDQDTAVIEYLTRPLMSAFHYPISEKRNLSNLLKARWRTASWPLRRRLIKRRLQASE